MVEQRQSRDTGASGAGGNCDYKESPGTRCGRGGSSSVGASARECCGSGSAVAMAADRSPVGGKDRGIRRQQMPQPGNLRLGELCEQRRRRRSLDSEPRSHRSPWHRRRREPGVQDVEETVRRSHRHHRRPVIVRRRAAGSAGSGGRTSAGAATTRRRASETAGSESTAWGESLSVLRETPVRSDMSGPPALSGRSGCPGLVCNHRARVEALPGVQPLGRAVLQPRFGVQPPAGASCSSRLEEVLAL